MRQFFSSDPHLFHEAMFKTFRIPCPNCGATGIKPITSDPCPDCGGKGEVPARPFSSVEEMHKVMISAHNARVSTQDHWYCLGDVTLLRSSSDKGMVVQEVKKFNGHKRLILGNHDHFGMDVYRDCGFQKIRGSHRIGNLLFSHFPVHAESIPHGCVNVHGHIHTNPSPSGPYINVSVEALNYSPISLEELQVRAAELLAG